MPTSSLFFLQRTLFSDDTKEGKTVSLCFCGRHNHHCFVSTLCDLGDRGVGPTAATGMRKLLHAQHLNVVGFELDACACFLHGAENSIARLVDAITHGL